jgi:NEDD4-binding protein 2
MKQIKVMRGISGSGKSTLAAKLAHEALDLGGCATICSADDFFINNEGEYKFDPTKLGLAHKSCLRAFLAALHSEFDLVIVDNTNLNIEDLAPYVALGEAFDYDVEILQVDTPLDVAKARGTHGVPPASVVRMERLLKNVKIPNRFKVVHISDRPGFGEAALTPKVKR